METRRRIFSPSSPYSSTIPNEEQDEESNGRTHKSNKIICRKRFFLLLIVISLFLLLLSKGIITNEIQMQDVSSSLHEEEEEEVRKKHPHDDSSYSLSVPPPPTKVGNCKNLQYTSPLPPKHKPIWIASYPGSGSEMVRDLVQTLTGGLVGGSVYIQRDPPYKDCLSSHAATCKTHWPLLPIHSPLDFPQKYHHQAILLVRNPIHAFSSRFNHLWEVRASIPAHTRQAPEPAWNKWIQKNWKQQVTTYRQLIQTWTNNTNTSFPYQVQLVLAYEDLTRKPQQQQDQNATTTSMTGAMAAKRLVQVLHQANARVVVGDESIACLWKHVVLDRPKMKRSDHSYVPGYTVRIQERILEMIQTDLLEPLVQKEKEQQQQEQQQSNDQVHQDLIRLLQGYSKYIQENTRII